jgi:hypothetical protein
VLGNKVLHGLRDNRFVYKLVYIDAGTASIEATASASTARTAS